MSQIDILVHSLYRNILERGYEYNTDNREVSYKQITSATLDIDLVKEFPLLTTKKMFTKGIVEELLWFLKGESDTKKLRAKGVDIWDKDTLIYHKRKFPADINLPLEEFREQMDAGIKSVGDVGRNYGVQWRDWTHGEMYAGIGQISSFDQITNLLGNLDKPNPINRRHIVTAWNPAELDQTALPSCHWAFEILPFPLTYSQRAMLIKMDEEYYSGLWTAAFTQNDVEAKEILEKELADVSKYSFTLKWHQRSVDSFLGLPFNIASYALLSHILGSLTGLIPMGIIGDLSNVHFYKPHLSAVEQQLANSPAVFPGCTLKFSDRYQTKANAYRAGMATFDEFLEDLDHTDFMFEDYQSFPAIKAEMYEPTK